MIEDHVYAEVQAYLDLSGSLSAILDGVLGELEIGGYETDSFTPVRRLAQRTAVAKLRLCCDLILALLPPPGLVTVDAAVKRAAHHYLLAAALRTQHLNLLPGTGASTDPARARAAATCLTEASVAIAHGTAEFATVGPLLMAYLMRPAPLSG